jgi:CsoR family transcriptional regulator, copper-sensing transcriptional repressor
VVAQVASATCALQELAVGLLNDHLHHCVRDATRRSGAEGGQVLDEVTGTIREVIRL